MRRPDRHERLCPCRTRWSLDGRPGIEELDAEHAFPEWTDRAMFVGYLTVGGDHRHLRRRRAAVAVPRPPRAGGPAAGDRDRAGGAEPRRIAAMVLVPLAILNWAPASVGLQDTRGPVAGEPADRHVPRRRDRGHRHAPGRGRVVAVCFALPIGRWFVDDSFDALPIWLGAVVIGVTIGIGPAPADRVDGRPQGRRGRPGREGRHGRAPAHRPRGARRHRPLVDRDDAPHHRRPARRRPRRRRRGHRGARSRPSGSAGRA